MVEPESTSETIEEEANGHTRGYKRFLGNGRRYKTETIHSAGQSVRWRTLTAREYWQISDKPDEHLLQMAMVDDEGKEEIAVEELSEFMDSLEANVFCEMLYKARRFCLPLTLPGMIEKAAKN